MQLLLLCACAAVAVAAPIDQWDAFLLTYSKIYDDGEMQFRRIIFEKTLAFIKKHNEEAAQGLQTYTVGINEFADWTDEEYKMLLGAGGDRPPRDSNDQSPVKVDGHLPSNIDWRSRGAVTPVRNQGQCGSCWAFGATGSMEGVCFLKKRTLYDLSEQQLVDCSRAYGNLGCGGGWHHDAYRYVIDAGGSVTEESYRYEARDARCRFEQARHAIVCTLTGYKTSRREEGLASDLNTVGPIGVAIDSSRAGFRYYRSGIYDDRYCNRVRSDHIVLVVGYDSSAWIVKNSWGTHWGNQGYILMRRGYNICGIANQAHYPTM